MALYTYCIVNYITFRSDTSYAQAHWEVGERGGVSQVGPMTLLLRVQKNKQVESCFLNHNSSIHFCCTDSLLMTHRGGLSLGIIIWRIWGRGPSFFLPWGPKIPWQPWLCLLTKVLSIYFYIQLYIPCTSKWQCICTNYILEQTMR